MLRRAVLALLALVLAAPGVWAGTSNSLMDLSPDGTQLLVANPDSGTVTVVDTVARKALREIKVGDKPEGVTWIGTGPLAAVTVYREDLVVFFNASDGQIVKKVKVANEPYGIVANKDGSRAWVTHDYPGLITELNPQKQRIADEYKVGSFIRGICLSPDESRLYVTEFYTGNLHAVDAKNGKILDSWKGQSVDNLSRNVVVHPTRPKAYLSHIRSKIDLVDGSGSIFPQLTVYDLVPANGTERRKSIAMDTYNALYVVTNPWEAALSPDGKVLYTIYAGTNDMNVNRTIDDDYKEIESITIGRLGQLPKAIRVSPDGKTVYVYNTMDFEVGVYSTNMQKQASIKVCEPAKTPEWVKGKILFSTANAPLTSRRWIACSSCHPDGLTDGRIWRNPEGLRKTPHFFGMGHTHPLHWSADRDEVQDFEYTIRGRLMQGRGLLVGAIKPKQGFSPTELDEKLSGRSADLDALAIYSNSFEATTLSPHIPGPGQLSAGAERGKTLFFSKETACATCHNGPYFTDSSLQKPFKVHDVGTGKDDPGEKVGPRYDTPSLLYVYRTAPYLHHGKAKTLHEVLTVCNKENKHGKTSQLKSEQVDDLVEFLKALPYERPPLETPNTVKDRVQPKKE